MTNTDTWEPPSLKRRRERLEAEAAVRLAAEEATMVRLRAMGIPRAMEHLAATLDPALYKLAERAFGYAPGWSSCRLRGDLVRACPPAPRRDFHVPATMAWSDGHTVAMR